MSLVSHVHKKNRSDHGTADRSSISNDWIVEAVEKKKIDDFS